MVLSTNLREDTSHLYRHDCSLCDLDSFQGSLFRYSDWKRASEGKFVKSRFFFSVKIKLTGKPHITAEDVTFLSVSQIIDHLVRLQTIIKFFNSLQFD